MALNVEQGLRMIEAAKKAGVKLMIAHVVRYFPEYQAAKRAMEDGSLGKPVMVRTYRGGNRPSGWFMEVGRALRTYFTLIVFNIMIPVNVKPR